MIGIALSVPVLFQLAMGRIKLDKITDFTRHGYDVKVTCEACGKVTHWVAVELAMELHRRRKPTRIEAVEPLMKCSACGKKRAIIQPVGQF